MWLGLRVSCGEDLSEAALGWWEMESQEGKPGQSVSKRVAF
jgi:hypothetical protein